MSGNYCCGMSRKEYFDNKIRQDWIEDQIWFAKEEYKKSLQSKRKKIKVKRKFKGE